MSLSLTEEMSAAVRQVGEQPVTLEDSQTHSRYVLLPLEVYERMVLANEPWSVTDAYAAQSIVAGASGWDDLEMGVYDDYDAHRPNS